LKNVSLRHPIKGYKDFRAGKPVITSKQQSGLSVKDLPDEPSSLP